MSPERILWLGLCGLLLAAYTSPVLRAQTGSQQKESPFDTDTLKVYRSICESGSSSVSPYDSSTQQPRVAVYDQKTDKVNPEVYREPVVEPDLRADDPRVARWLVCLNRETEYRFDFQSKSGEPIQAHRDVWRVRLFDLKKADQEPVVATFFGKDPPRTIFLLGSSGGGPVTGADPTKEFRSWVGRNVSR